MSLLPLASSKTRGISLFLYPHYLLSLSPNVDRSVFLGVLGGILCMSTTISLYWANTSMWQSSYRTQGMLWPSVFPLLLHSGEFSYSENPRKIGKYHCPLSLFVTAYPLPFSSLLHVFMLSLLSFYYFLLARVTVSIFLF